MTPARFLESRRAVWNRLESLASRAAKRGLRSLSQAELHELTRLYPAVAVDVARARMYQVDPVTQNRVNQLAIAAHGLLYRRRSTRSFPAIWQFLRQRYPRLFRRIWPYMTVATAIFMIGMLGTYVATRLVPSNAYIFVPYGLDVTPGGVTSEDISERFRQLPHPPMATGIMVNNVSVAITVFAFGITAGIGTCYILLLNAMMLGGFAAHFTNHDLSYPLWAFIAPHGTLEIFAILVSSAAGLRLGYSLVVPGRMTRAASLRLGARDAVLLMLGTIPMFVIAGFIEGFVTPSYLPGAAKIVLGVTVPAAVIAHLLVAGRQAGADAPADSRRAGIPS
jgi:uncharacterized membrane protein SpoIIM required for sporulation